MPHQPDDKGFTEVNGVRFDANRVAIGFHLRCASVEMSVAARDVDVAPEGIADAYEALRLTAPERAAVQLMLEDYACVATAGEAVGQITFGQLIQALSDLEQLEAEAEDDEA